MDFNFERVNCNLCESSGAKFYASVSYMDYLKRRPELKSYNDPILKNRKLANYKFNMVKCKKCGLIYINPRLTISTLSELYREEYFSQYDNVKSEASRKRALTFQSEITELEHIVDRYNVHRYILDVGCGGGFFLAQLDGRWKKLGIEINPSAVNYGRKRFGIKILEGNLDDAHFPDNHFGVIKMRGVVEHLPDPISKLREIYRILDKGGLIGINTPNIGSFCGRIYKEKFRMVCPIHHIYYFSTNTLSDMLEKVGFRILKISYHYFDTPYYNWSHLPKVLYDIFSFNIFRNKYAVSPPFYGNAVDIYATK
jgi:SAM-dependent methyltransferase